MKSIKQIKNLKNKRVLVRVYFNVPIRNGKILDTFRIEKAMPTINYLRKKGAQIILMSHLGSESGKTLKPVADYINKKYFKVELVGLGEVFGGKKTQEELITKKHKNLGRNDLLRFASEVPPPKIFMLENLRQNKGEEKNDINFAMKLAGLADLYVNEAFPVCHRNHASIVSVPKFLPSYAGLQLEEEVKNLSLALKPVHPFLFVLGGAKFDTKIPLIHKFLGLASKDNARHASAEADAIFVGGALMNNFYKEEGLDVGKSLVEKENFGLMKLCNSGKIILPIDVVVESTKARKHESTETRKRITSVDKAPEYVLKNEAIMDIGPYSTEILVSLIKQAKFVLMNGPMGNYEAGFGKATEEAIKALAKSKAKVIIGGGDTVALISRLEKKGLKVGKNIFVSTGGGATLDFLASGTLPGIEALESIKAQKTLKH